VIIPYLVDRRMAIHPLVINAPHKLKEISAFKSHKIKFPDTLRNCEDILLDEELGIAYLSCDPGRDRWNTVMVSN
jgi:arylesterase / paraoxonase